MTKQIHSKMAGYSLGYGYGSSVVIITSMVWDFLDVTVRYVSWTCQFDSLVYERSCSAFSDTPLHSRFARANSETTINEYRPDYWISGVRNTVWSVVRKCQLHMLLKDHPQARLAYHHRAFRFTGVDYFGPATVTIGRRREKRWIVSFSCVD